MEVWQQRNQSIKAGKGREGEVRECWGEKKGKTEKEGKVREK